MNSSDHHADNDKPTMGDNPGEQGDFASGQDDEGQHAEQAVDHSARHEESLEEKTDDEVGPSTEREHPTPKAPGQDTDTDGANHTGDADDTSDDAHANEPRTDAAAPPAQGPAA